MSLSRATVPIAAAVSATLVLAAVSPSALNAQDAERGLAVTLPSDSAELAYLTELIQTALQPPVQAGPAAGEFVAGRIYPFGGAGRYLVVGVLEDAGSGEASWVVHPFGRGLEEAPSRVLGPGALSLDVIGIGDIAGYGGFIVVYCERPSTASTVPTMLVFDDGWTERDLRGSPVWHCDGQVPGDR
jgi:hypothetical protein